MFSAALTSRTAGKWKPPLLEIVKAPAPIPEFAAALKFNPYHDEKGQFSSGDGAAFVSTSGVFARQRNSMKDAYEVKAFHATPISYQKTSQEEHAKEMLAASQHQWDSLSESQAAAIQQYTGMGHLDSVGEKDVGTFYALINTAIGTAKGDMSQLTVVDRDAVNLLDSALAKGSLTKDSVFYKAATAKFIGAKGVHANSTEAELKALVGTTLEDHAYSSMSSSDRVAYGFSESDRIMLQLEAPKGTKGMWVGGNSTGVRRTNYEDEYEFVAPRNSKYHVTGVNSFKDSTGKQVHTVVATIIN